MGTEQSAHSPSTEKCQRESACATTAPCSLVGRGCLFPAPPGSAGTTAKATAGALFACLTPRCGTRWGDSDSCSPTPHPRQWTPPGSGARTVTLALLRGDHGQRRLSRSWMFPRSHSCLGPLGPKLRTESHSGQCFCGQGEMGSTWVLS